MPYIHWPVRALPVIRTAGRYPLDDQDFEFRYRSVTHALHLYDYNGTIRMDGHTYPLQPGVLTLSPAKGRSWYDLPQPGHHWCIHFLPVKSTGKTIALPWYLPAGPHRGFMTDRMAEIARLHNRTHDPAAQAAAAVELQGLLLRVGRLADQRQSSTGRADAAVDKLFRLLNERFAEPWTVPQLADQAGLTQDYLAKSFRRRCGVTIPRYLLQRRIEHAQYLLGYTDLPINRIAARVGMPDPQHFNKQFRRLVGHSPTQARMTGGA